MEAIKKFINLNKNQIHISVVGDLLIDEYYHVVANRVSPEFPIPILLSNNLGIPTAVYPGGAGNVCNQFKNFNAHVDLFAFVNCYGVEVLDKASLKARNCVMLPEDNTIPVKRRLYHGEFPLCRWDIEQANYGWLDIPGRIDLEKHQKMLLDKFLKTKAADVVILSDYNKGVFSNSKKMWVRDDRQIIVDPKKGPVEDWEGCYIFKPNNKEAIELSGGITDWKEQCKFFYRTLKCKSVVITRGEDSVVGIVDGHTFEYKSEYKPNTDSMGYSGAGDCFVAFLAMGIAHKLDIEEAAALAFNAAAIYVGKRHNDPITPMELLGLIDERERIKQVVGKYISYFNEEEKELFFEELRKL